MTLVKNEIFKTWIFGLIEDFCPSMMSTKNQSQFYYFLGIFAGKIGIKPERSPVARLRICFFVLSMVTPMELINRGEQAPAPSHWSPKHPFLSKQKVGWPKVGRSLWQQLKRKRFDSDDRSCVSFVSFKPHTVLKYHSKILMIEWTNYSDTIKVKITEKSSIWSKIHTTVQECKQIWRFFLLCLVILGDFQNCVTRPMRTTTYP